MTEADQAARPIVLLLENDPLQLFALSDYIEEAGCEVLPTSNAAEAVRILERRTDIRVVFADLDVRGSMTGLKLVAMIRERWPPVELILTGSIKPDLAMIPARGVFHDKPFDERRITDSIRQFVRAL